MNGFSVVERFDGVKPKSGGGWIARCPAHGDRKQSLSIDERDGKLLIKCFAGCAIEEILAAKAIEKAELFLEQRAAAGRSSGITVDSLAASKGLPVEILRRYGARTVKDLPSAERLQYGIGGSDGVWIPYFNPDGSIAARTRLRTAHVAKDGSRWLGGFGAILPYGLHDLADARDQGIVCICEGESDYWTLRACEIPALGLPGAQMVRVLQREHLEGIKTVYVCQDSDPAGVSFVASIRQHTATWGLIGVFAVPIPGVKDVNDLYRKDPKGCGDRLTELMQRAATVAAPAAREFSTAGEIYRLTVPEWGLSLELDQVRRASWGDLTGELAVISDKFGDLSRANVNLSQLDRRQNLAALLAKRTGLAEVDWPALVEDFAIRALKAEREGQPSVNLRDVPRPAPDDVLEVDGIVLPRRHPSCLFGDGGTGKSYLALYVAGTLTRQGVRCAYVDAELDAGEHRERLWRLFGDEFPAVEYLRLDRALVYAVDQLRRLVRDKKIEYLVLDSVGVLTAGAPESAEAANGYIRALRQIGIGSLSIAHVTKNGEHNDQKPFGSVFYHNGFRCTWYAAQADLEVEATEGGPLSIGLWNRKSNLSRRHRPIGLELEFLPDATMIRRVDLATVEGLAGKLPVWRQIEGVLRRGPQTSAALADEIGASENTVRVALSKGKKRGRFVLLPGSGSAMWALAEVCATADYR